MNKNTIPGAGFKPPPPRLKEDLDVALDYLEEYVVPQTQGIPSAARGCLWLDVPFHYALLHYDWDAENIRELVTKLRSLRENPPQPTATSLADAVIALDPIATEFGVGAPWTGDMAWIAADCVSMLGDSSIQVAVRGAGKCAAKRKLAYLFRSLGVPA